MKKILIFDLKNTLIYLGDRLCDDYGQIMTKAKRQGFELLLYSMNEPWTYTVLGKYADAFSEFQTVLLTTKKKNDDLRPVAAAYDIALMVGDGQEEQGIARNLGYPFLLVREELRVQAFSKWLEEFDI